MFALTKKQTAQPIKEKNVVNSKHSHCTAAINLLAGHATPTRLIIGSV